MGIESSATLNYQLTTFAQGHMNDLSDARALAERLAPSTPVPGSTGQFKKFNDKNSFLPEDTSRALGGDPKLIATSASDDTYSCKPQALEVRVDQAEIDAAGSGAGALGQQLLREGKVAALLNKAALSHSVQVVTAVLAAVTPQPSLGVWSDPAIDPIDQLDSQLLALSNDCGSATNIKLTIDVGAWSALRSHPKVQPGSAAVSAAWVQIHGATKWYVNDTNSKGDYALLEWFADFRTFGEFTRLSSINDCSGAHVTGFPMANAGGGPVESATQFASFTQTPGCLPFMPCAPKVVCISPNGETFPNGTTYDFPAEFVCDEQYGSKWWAFVQSTMTDLFWQRPHRPCNIKPCAKWTMDGGTCAEDTEGSCPGDEDYVPGESEPPEYFFGHAPQVETRLTVPANYGAAQDESAPALPTGIQIGWLSPVDNSTGEVAYPPEPPGAEQDRGNPAGAATAWDLHSAMCAHSADCQFNYQLPAC